MLWKAFLKMQFLPHFLRNNLLQLYDLKTTCFHPAKLGPNTIFNGCWTAVSLPIFWDKIFSFGKQLYDLKTTCFDAKTLS